MNWRLSCQLYGLLRAKVYSTFHPFGVGKWVPAIAGKGKANAFKRIDIVTLFWRSGKGINVPFKPQRRYKGNTLIGGFEYTGMGNVFYLGIRTR